MADSQSVVYRGILLLVLGLDRTLPLFFVGLSAELLKRIEAVSRYTPLLEKAFGSLFLGLGGYYLYQAWLFLRLSFSLA